MTSQSESNSHQPPRFAAWLIRIFSTSADDADSIAGDLSEEFAELASVEGLDAARGWYTRQTLRTIPHLLAAGFRAAPWTVITMVIGAFLVRWWVSMHTSPALSSLLTRLYPYDADDPRAYLFWLTTSMLFIRWIENALVGLLVAAIANGREMVVTIGLALLGIALAIPSIGITIAGTGDFGVLRTLPHTLLFSVTIVAAGTLVRTFRIRTNTASAI